jgi:hypothetical protein
MNASWMSDAITAAAHLLRLKAPRTAALLEEANAALSPEDAYAVMSLLLASRHWMDRQIAIPPFMWAKYEAGYSPENVAWAKRLCQCYQADRTSVAAASVQLLPDETGVYP